MKKLILISLFVTTQFFAQISEITQFPLQDSTKNYSITSIVELDNNELLFFWIEDTQIKMSKSNDGINWGTISVLIDSLAEGKVYQDLVTYKINSGKIIVAYRANKIITEYHFITSIDNGITWSNPELLIKSPFPTSTKKWDGKFSQTSDDKVWFTYNRTTNLEYCTSVDDGITWSERVIFTTTASSGNVISIGDSLMFIYSYKGSDLLFKLSNDNGTTWNSAITILNDSNINGEPSVIKRSDGSLMIVYRVLELLNYFVIESFDNGATWSDPAQFTKYSGDDLGLSINSNSKNLYASFVSLRTFNENNFETEEERYSIWYGIIGQWDDINTPPSISEIARTPYTPSSLDTLIITAKIIDNDSVSKVFMNYKLNEVLQTPLEMFDDGLHNDGIADDSIYGATLNGLNPFDKIIYSINALDINNFSATRFGDEVQFNIPMSDITTYIDINRFKLPIDNKGVLADVLVDENISGSFDGKTILFSGGFGLSGYDNGEIWANAVQSASRIEDYQAGIVGAEKDDLINKVYKVKSSDVPFGETWLSWHYAVLQGAKFYDGDGDGVYDPVDLNNNGVWDENEDRPDLIGDVTAWTVFNDGLPKELRRFSVKPKSIEIRQTVFGYAPDTHEELDGVIYLRYEIENKSSTEYNMVYFSSMSDPDVGDYVDDLVGCDTTLNSGYAYDNDEDAVFNNSPTFMPTIIQGAPVYISGETFEDNNSNGIYDDGVDTPLDTAKYHYGSNFEDKEFIGAKNQNMTSFTHYMGSHPTLGDPDTHIELREYMLGGHGKAGDSLYVSSWDYGNGASLGADTLNIPSHYMYSGNPVTNEGWINTEKMDQRMMVNSGPFTLRPNEPVEIIVAYIAGRGSTSLESIDVTRQIANDAIGFYNTNFNYVPVGVNDKSQKQIPTEYSLSQNYPNPFNPSTTIKYSIPQSISRESSVVSIVVYDILGREVSTLVKRQQKAGNYEVQFDAGNLTSGVYFYRLQSGSFNESKKMVLIK